VELSKFIIMSNEFNVLLREPRRHPSKLLRKITRNFSLATRYSDGDARIQFTLVSVESGCPNPVCKGSRLLTNMYMSFQP
jgi:hypothetical protein